jgi:16S rRNA (uracil1498-N3)-methyltransferase
VNAGGAWCAATVAAAHVFVAPEVLRTDLLRIDGPDGHHLARVRRLGPGEVVTAADGAGRWRRCVVAAVEGAALVLEPTAPIATEPEAAPRLAVAFAPTKGDQPERVVAALTELGVDEIIPVLTRRSVVAWRGERAAKQGERLRRIAREAAAQCRRATLPVVADPTGLGSLAGRPVVVADRDGDPGTGLEAPGPEGWTVLVGPEGGLDPEDLAGFPGATRIAVGPHILRADTAPIAVAAVLTERRILRGS